MSFAIREALPGEYAAIGQLLVQVYANLEGFPGPQEMPHYYAMLAGIGSLASKPGASLLVASAECGLLGGVVHFSDMAQYGSGGTATLEKDASGFRLLGVAPEARGLGVGKALMEACLQRAREDGHGTVIIHTTEAMKTAWKMYEARGFQRAPELDFKQGALQVFGFRYAIGTAPAL